MKLTTASQVVRFAKEMEDKIEVFYKNLAEKYKEQSEIFSSFAKESRKNKTVIQRTYQGVVSDALETGYSFDEFVVDDYIPGLLADVAQTFERIARRIDNRKERLKSLFK